MKIASILENQNIEKRIAITPEIAKKYISLGIDVCLCENYASHLGIKDEEYKELGVSILKDEKETLINSDVIVPLGFLGIVPLAFIVALTGLEILIAFLQAYVFAILTCLYINDAINLH